MRGAGGGHPAPEPERGGQGKRRAFADVWRREGEGDDWRATRGREVRQEKGREVEE